MKKLALLLITIMVILTGCATSAVADKPSSTSSLSPSPILSPTKEPVVTFPPNISPAFTIAQSISGPSKDWYDALTWLKGNTPKPVGDPASFYNYYESRTGAKFFIAQDEAAANKILNELSLKYVTIDLEMAIPYRVQNNVVQQGGFNAIALWAGDNPDNYFDTYYEQNNGKSVPLYYPEYYQSMCARLYCFKGAEVRPRNSTVVISYVERSGRKEILSEQTFGTYEEAKTFLSKQTGTNWRIVGTNPFISPVPLKALEHYKPIYHSDSWSAKFEDNVIAYVVEIYSYTP